MPITQGEEAAIEAALGAQVARQLLNLLNAQGPPGPVAPPLVNHTQPIYAAADTDYSETIEQLSSHYNQKEGQQKEANMHNATESYWCF